MLTRDELQSLIVCRIYAASDSCNSRHITAVEGQVRALIAVLNDGTPPPAHGDSARYLDAAGIPVMETGNMFEIPDDWLLSHGFIIDQNDPDAAPRHARFSGF